MIEIEEQTLNDPLESCLLCLKPNKCGWWSSDESSLLSGGEGEADFFLVAAIAAAARSAAVALAAPPGCSLACSASSLCLTLTLAGAGEGGEPDDGWGLPWFAIDEGGPASLRVTSGDGGGGNSSS